MRTTETAKTDDLMAIWQATGGAMPATPRIAPGEADDGLEAVGPTIVRDYCLTDDGLKAGRPTASDLSCTPGIGLAAASFTHPADTCWN